jgi:hypothetical protein
VMRILSYCQTFYLYRLTKAAFRIYFLLVSVILIIMALALAVVIVVIIVVVIVR